MSVINETLDNLKKSQTQKTTALDPSASAYADRSEKVKVAAKSDKSIIMPLSLAIVVGIIFSVYHATSKPSASVQSSSGEHTAFVSAGKPAQNKQQMTMNSVAQGQYYIAMNLLNEGKQEQALIQLKDIVEHHPEFIPAKNVYSMLSTH